MIKPPLVLDYYYVVFVFTSCGLQEVCAVKKTLLNHLILIYLNIKGNLWLLNVMIRVL